MPPAAEHLTNDLPPLQALAEDFPDVAFDIHLMPDLMQCVQDSDVIFAASSSEELLVKKEEAAAMRPAGEKAGGVRRFIDISVPRNFASNINEVGCNQLASELLAP